MTELTRCQKCGQNAVRIIPAGVSSKTGKKYAAFAICNSCNDKPRVEDIKQLTKAINKQNELKTDTQSIIRRSQMINKATDILIAIYQSDKDKKMFSPKDIVKYADKLENGGVLNYINYGLIPEDISPPDYT